MSPIATSRSERAWPAWHAHLVERLEAPGDETLDYLARGVATWCALRDTPVEEAELRAGLTRALAMAGRTDEARRTALTGAIHPVRVESRGGLTLWSVRADRLADPKRPDFLEIAFLPVLRIAVEEAARRSVTEGGVGVGLSGLGGVARRMAGAGAGRKAVRARLSELRNYCASVLSRVWTGDVRPEILWLDTAA